EDRIVILSTHIVGDIEATCEAIAIMDEGHLLYTGTVDDLLAQAVGRVFLKVVDRQDLPRLRKQYTITSMHTQGSKTHIRLLSDHIISDALACEPNIEDAYMLYLYENGAVMPDIGGETK
ncbi:MAG: ABC transporter ATP-binding protein, partial [Eubacterium sp.]